MRGKGELKITSLRSRVQHTGKRVMYYPVTSLAVGHTETLSRWGKKKDKILALITYCTVPITLIHVLFPSKSLDIFFMQMKEKYEYIFFSS